MSVHSIQNDRIQGYRSADSGRRWASFFLAMLLSIAWPNLPPLAVNPAHASAAAGVATLESTKMQPDDPTTKLLTGSPELWKFRLIKAR